MLVSLLGAQGVAVGALGVLSVEYAQHVLHRGGDWVGYLNAAFGAGGVIAVVMTARLVGKARLIGPLVLALAVWSLSFIGLAALPGAVGALALIAVGGSARATFDVAGRTLLQRVARPDLLWRHFGLLEGLMMGACAVGSLLAPLLVWARRRFACLALRRRDPPACSIHSRPTTARHRPPRDRAGGRGCAPALDASLRAAASTHARVTRAGSRTAPTPSGSRRNPPGR
jgi:hypothetical protein